MVMPADELQAGNYLLRKLVQDSRLKKSIVNVEIGDLILGFQIDWNTAKIDCFEEAEILLAWFTYTGSDHEYE